MGERTGIEWTNAPHPNGKLIPGKTFNPWIGCSKVSDACRSCYAEIETFARVERSRGRELWGVDAQRHITSESNWRQPLKWEKWAREGTCWECSGRGQIYPTGNGAPERRARACETCNAAGRVEPYRYRVFCSSLADVFERRDDLVQMRIRLFDLIRQTPNLDWLLLTKRPHEVLPMLAEARDLSADCQTGDGYEKCVETHRWLQDWLDGRAPENVWPGTTTENQEWFDKRYKYLTAIPAKYRFISCEPLLGPIRLPNDVTGRCYGCQSCGFQGFHRISEPKIHWVITGGESGADARMTHPRWVKGLRDQCVQAGIAFFHKQNGEWKPISEMSEAEYQALYRSNRIAEEGEDQAAVDEVYGQTCTVPVSAIGYGGAVGYDKAFHVVEGHSGMQMFRVGKKNAGRTLDGVEWNESPTGVK